MRPVLFACVFILSACVARAQQHTVDSLTKRLDSTMPDSDRAMTMMRLAIAFEGVDSAKCMRTYRDAIVFALQHKLHYEAGRIYYNLSFPYNYRSDYARSRAALDSAAFYLNLSDHKDAAFRKAQVYENIGNLFRNEGDNKKFIEYKMKAAELFEKMNKPESEIVNYLNISSFYKDIREYHKQKEYALKALAIARSTKSSKGLFSSYTHMAFALNMESRFTEAKTYLDSCEMYYAESSDPRVNHSYHLIAGLTYMNLYKESPDNLNKSEAHFRKALVMAERFSYRAGSIQSRLQLARILTLKKQFADAKQTLLGIMNELKEHPEPTQLEVALEYLLRLYEESGDYKSALETYKAYTSLTDSVAGQQNKFYSTTLEKKYEAEKRERQIIQLTADNKIQQLYNYILVAGSIVLLIILLLTYRTYRQRQLLQRRRISELETEKHLLATEAVLKGEEQERTRMAKDLHDGLGGMLSGIKHSLSSMKQNLIMTPENQLAFERSLDMLDSSIKEMRRVAHNMMPEALIRFGLDAALRDFCNDINQSGALVVNYQSIALKDSTLDQSISITLFRIIQELIHNTMKHASATSALVQISLSEGKLFVTVEDDGRGFEPSQLQNSSGIGWTNIISRVEFLKGKWDIKSKAGEGTSVHIELDV